MKINEYDLRCHIYDNYVKTDRQRKWLDDILKGVEIRLYSNETKEERKDYDEYCEYHNLDMNEFRALSWSNGLIMLNGFNETLDSLSWLLLHELGHTTSRKIAHNLGYELLHMLSGGSLDEMTKEEYTNYVTNDDAHEERYEEQFANQFANIIIGKCYDRKWWRKNK